MADVFFVPRSVPRRALAMAERIAILRPLVRVRPDKLVKDADVTGAMFKVLEMWRRRCNDLRTEGWGPAQTVKFQYMRNCPPVTVCVDVENRASCTRPCCIATVCPWCWSRENVKKTWDTIYPLMVARHLVFDEDHVGEYSHKLVVATRYGVVPDDNTQPEAVFDQLHGAMTRARRAWTKVALGGACLAAVYPSKRGWAYSDRVIALMPQATPVSDKYKVVTHPTKRNIAGAVARFARYSAGMLRGEAGPLIRLLDVRSKFRLYRTFGACNGRFTGGTSAPEEDTRFLDL